MTGEVGRSEDIVSIERAELPVEELQAALAVGASIVIMPHARTEDGRGVYGESTLFLVKELRAQCLDAKFADESERRVFEVKKSALADGVVTIVLGLASAGLWEVVKIYILGWFEDKKMEMTYTDLSADGREESWTVRGQGKDVLAAIDKIRRQPPSVES